MFDIWLSMDITVSNHVPIFFADLDTCFVLEPTKIESSVGGG